MLYRLLRGSWDLRVLCAIHQEKKKKGHAGQHLSLNASPAFPDPDQASTPWSDWSFKNPMGKKLNTLGAHASPFPQPSRANHAGDRTGLDRKGACEEEEEWARDCPATPQLCQPFPP